MKRPIEGFTLAELLVVVVILALVAALLLPVLAAARDKDRQAQCKSRHKCNGLAMNMYSNDYGEFYPTMGVDVPTVSATPSSIVVTPPDALTPMRPPTA